MLLFPSNGTGRLSAVAALWSSFYLCPLKKRCVDVCRVGDGRRLQSDPSVSGEEAPDLQALAGQSQEAARRAQDMLKEMQQLKTEMKMLLAVSYTTAVSARTQTHTHTQQMKMNSAFFRKKVRH